MANFFITKQNDTKPLEAILEDENGAVNLDSSTIVFNMWDENKTLKVNRASVTIVSATQGRVKYSFDPADTDTAGTYQGEFEVTFSDSTVTTFPNDSYIPIRIVDDIA